MNVVTNQTTTQSTTLKANFMVKNTNLVISYRSGKPSHKFVKNEGKSANSVQNNYTKTGAKNNKPPALTGFNLQIIFKALSFFHPCAAIFTEAANIAAVTDQYLIVKSHKQLAEISNVSQSTAYRHCNAADALGFINTIPVYCPKTKARLPNTYQLTSQLLSFGIELMSVLKGKRLSFCRHVKAIKNEVAKLLIKYKFEPTPPTSKCSTPPHQDDVTNNQYTSVKVRKTEKAAPVKSGHVKPVSLTFIQEMLAIGSAKRSNERSEAKRQEKAGINHQIREKAMALARKMAYFKAPQIPKKSEDAFKADYANTDYSAPAAGFRTA